MAAILIVDDEAEIRKLLGMALERQGHTVMTAADGRQGMALFEGNEVDLVVLDIIMPEMDGIEVFRSLRRQVPGIPIIAISGGGRISSDDYLQIIKTLGANATFDKPLAISSLVEKVDELLAERIG